MASNTSPSTKAKKNGRGAAKKAPSRAVDAARRAGAARADKPAADTTEAKHRRASEMLRQLRTDVEALSANADRLLSRFPL